MKKSSSDSQQKGARERSLRVVSGGVRRHTIRRQVYIYLSLIGAGVYFLVASGFEKIHLLSEGIAFIMVGAVGLIMSTTTTDIGQSLLLAVREEGSKTRALNKKLVRHLGKAIREDGRQTRAAIKEDGRQTRASIEDIGKQIKAVSSDIQAVSSDIQAVSSDIQAVSSDIQAMSRDNREFFRQMLETQNRILGKVS